MVDKIEGLVVSYFDSMASILYCSLGKHGTPFIYLFIYFRF